MKIKTELLPYQRDAYNKLIRLKVGALYMEMGLGKTRTALEIIQHRLEAGKLNKVLWLCPCSVKDNLRVDLQKHADGTEDIIRICGIETLSSSDKTYMDLLQYVGSGSVMLIVDESNLVKNYFSIRTKRITALSKTCKYKMILNGTPVTRNEADLYSQWYILDQRIFGYRSFYSFKANHLEYDKFGHVRRVLNVDYLTEKIAPYSYVIRKDDAIKLPPKHYQEEKFYLTESQQHEYAEVLDMLLSQVDEFDSSTIYRLFTGLQLVTSGREVWQERKNRRSDYHLKSCPFFDDPLQNPRIRALLNVLDEEKTLIWVKFVFEIEDIKKVLPAGSYALFYGGVPLKKRMQELERFRTDPECRYLIANKTCGGYGLNLQYCRNAVYYNNDFDYATRAQSEDRLHRIGQTRDVYITDISSVSKIDTRILENLSHKDDLCECMKKCIREKKDIKEWLS